MAFTGAQHIIEHELQRPGFQQVGGAFPCHGQQAKGECAPMRFQELADSEPSRPATFAGRGKFYSSARLRVVQAHVGIDDALGGPFPGELSDLLEIVDEGAHLSVARFLIGRAQDGRRMQSCSYDRRERGLHHLPTLAGDAEFAAQERLSRGCAQANQYLGLDYSQFGVKPRAASVNLRVARLLMNPSFSALIRRPFEMLHRIRDVYLAGINACLVQRLVQDFSGGSYKRTACPILLISGLLAHEHDSCFRSAFSEDGLRARLGEGASKARIMFVGEQPGDQEDRAGRPFVGPAGKILHKALDEAGIDTSEVYITNAVKHFKWSPDERGKRRIHKKPRYSEIHACRPWLDAELRVVQPQILVCLGATAAQSLLGSKFSVTRQRGQVVESPLAPIVTATLHPSAILRAPDEESRHAQMRAFVDDLKKVAQFARKRAA